MKQVIAWILAVIITFSAAIYQKLTGPTYPKSEKVVVNGKEHKIKFIRTHGGEDDAIINIEIQEKSVSANIYYRKYPTNNEWIQKEFISDSLGLSVTLPHLEPAGKYEYYVVIKENDNIIFENKKQVIKIRFKGDVPAYILIPHIFFMFFAMLLSTLAGLLVIFKHKRQKRYGMLAFLFLLLGGMVLGPIVQKFAFNEFWTGVPLGWDLTDNKSLIAFIAWLIAFVGNIKKPRPYLTLIAAIVLLIIFSIPHSMFGSELNPETGEVIQGMVLYLF